MTITMSHTGLVLLRAVRRNFELLAELDKKHPGDVDVIVGAMVQHLRSWRPQALMVLEAPPTEVRRG